MAKIRERATGELYSLVTLHLVGRGRRCDLRLDNRLISGDHAEFRWTGKGWALKDLGSSNGTFVDGRRLGRGEVVTLVTGAQIAFGGVEKVVFELVDAGPPIAVARSLDGIAVEGDEDGLYLPDEDNAQLIVYSAGPDRWRVEDLRDGSSRPVVDEARVEAGESVWQLCLPSIWEETEKPETGILRLADIGLQFRANASGDYVEMWIAHGARLLPLTPRSFGPALLAMARERVADQYRPDVPESEHGWMYLPELLTELGLTDSQLNVAVHRARKQLEKAGVLDATDLVQRRRQSRQIRMNITQIEILS